MMVLNCYMQTIAIKFLLSKSYLQTITIQLLLLFLFNSYLHTATIKLLLLNTLFAHHEYYTIVTKVLFAHYILNIISNISCKLLLLN